MRYQWQKGTFTQVASDRIANRQSPIADGKLAKLDLITTTFEAQGL
jgi:hypothetical protein